MNSTTLSQIPFILQWIASWPRPCSPAMIRRKLITRYTALLCALTLLAVPKAGFAQTGGNIGPGEQNITIYNTTIAFVPEVGVGNWTVYEGSTSVATKASPAGWSVALGTGGLLVGAPFGTALGSYSCDYATQ